MFGVEDLPLLEGTTHVMANKVSSYSAHSIVCSYLQIMPDFDIAVHTCLTEIIHRRENRIERDFYYDLPAVSFLAKF